jgi:hypothetical protein
MAQRNSAIFADPRGLSGAVVSVTPTCHERAPADAAPDKSFPLQLRDRHRIASGRCFFCGKDAALRTIVPGTQLGDLIQQTWQIVARGRDELKISR